MGRGQVWLMVHLWRGASHRKLLRSAWFGLWSWSRKGRTSRGMSQGGRGLGARVKLFGVWGCKSRCFLFFHILQPVVCVITARGPKVII
eukprot:1159224-Pelagomonas_calceolata.AAC.1